MYSIYLITNSINGLSYVGQTKQQLNARFSSHIRSANTSRLLLHRAIKKYGSHCFSISLLLACSTQDEANILEIESISRLNTLKPGGYNLHPGGGSAVPHTPDIRNKMSIAAKKRGTSVAWLDAALKAARRQIKGIPLTGARKLLVQETNRLRVWSKESRLKMSRTKTGRPSYERTEEHRQRMRNIKHGHVVSIETRHKMSLAKKGKPGHKHSPETIEKIRKAHIGKPRSAEYRAKISASLKLRNKLKREQVAGISA